MIIMGTCIFHQFYSNALIKTFLNLTVNQDMFLSTFRLITIELNMTGDCHSFYLTNLNFTQKIK